MLKAKEYGEDQHIPASCQYGVNNIFLKWNMHLIAQVVASKKQLKGSIEASQLEAQKRFILYQGNLQMLQINFLSPQQSFWKCQPCH